MGRRSSSNNTARPGHLFNPEHNVRGVLNRAKTATSIQPVRPDNNLNNKQGVLEKASSARDRARDIVAEMEKKKLAEEEKVIAKAKAKRYEEERARARDLRSAKAEARPSSPSQNAKIVSNLVEEKAENANSKESHGSINIPSKPEDCFSVLSNAWLRISSMLVQKEESKPLIQPTALSPFFKQKLPSKLTNNAHYIFLTLNDQLLFCISLMHKRDAKTPIFLKNFLGGIFDKTMLVAF